MVLKPAIVNVMEGAARKAARTLVRDFGEVEQLQVSRKDHRISSAPPTSGPRRPCCTNCARAGPVSG